MEEFAGTRVATENNKKMENHETKMTYAMFNSNSVLMLLPFPNCTVLNLNGQAEHNDYLLYIWVYVFKGLPLYARIQMFVVIVRLLLGWGCPKNLQFLIMLYFPITLWNYRYAPAWLALELNC